jgi:ABC-type sugar transport system substrate-binding protein
MSVIVSLPDQENEFQLLQADDARAAAARHGLDLVLLNAETSPVLQVQQLLKAIHSDPKPQAIVVEPLSIDTMESVVRKATTAGIGFALLNCTLENLTALRVGAKAPAFAVGSDQVEIGRLQGRQLRSLLPEGGQIVYIHGPQSGTCARERWNGFRQEIEGTRIESTVLDGHWSESSAEKAMASWLRLKLWEKTPIGAIVAQDDSMARGARRAIDAAPDVAGRLGPVPFLGIDGVPGVGLKLVDDGVLTATVVMPSNTGAALDVMARWLRAGTPPPMTVPMTPRPYPDVRPAAAATASKRRSA